jgi:dGTPase
MDRAGSTIGPEDGYTAPDRERWVSEPPKDPRRGQFARDRARVVHSSGLRRLAAKTQVVDPGTDDFVRNRLTHSLEVAQVGRELGALLGCDPDVVDAACLAHDLGHPPFGHNGEEVLAELAVDCGGFEGNAQTLRVLTRLEPKVVDPVSGNPAGLNLTRASLDATVKYPWGAGGEVGAGNAGKFGVYPEDGEVFRWLRRNAPEGRRCVEAQVMDLADDIAYSVHDVEDAIVGGYLDPRTLDDPRTVSQVTRHVRSWYFPQAEDEEIAGTLAWIRSLPAGADRCDGGYRALAALKDMTSQFIGRFTAAAENATRERFGPGRLTRYAADVIVPRTVRVEIAVLKGLSSVFVMTATDRQSVYSRQREVLTELVYRLLERVPAQLEPRFVQAWGEADDDAGRLRVVVDQVASLTDGSALAWHRRLTR